VSRFPKLKFLQLTHNPFVRIESELAERCGSHQQFATEILRQLYSNSPVVFLAFKPSLYSENYKGVPHLDSNGHRHPRYYYSRGETTATKLNGRKTTQVFTIPVKENDVLDFIRPKLLFASDPPESYCASVEWYQEHQ
jgi:hypothetical protein